MPALYPCLSYTNTETPVCAQSTECVVITTAEGTESNMTSTKQWTFRSLGEEETDAAVVEIVRPVGTWWGGLTGRGKAVAMVVVGLCVASGTFGIGIGVAAATGVLSSSTGAAASPPPAATGAALSAFPNAPPVPPVQPPFNVDESEDYCNNDCLGCGAACTYSYGNNGGVAHDSRYFQSDGHCDDGGAGSEFSYCRYGSDCADCGVRAMPPPPPDYPSTPPFVA